MCFGLWLPADAGLQISALIIALLRFPKEMIINISAHIRRVSSEKAMLLLTLSLEKDAVAPSFCEVDDVVAHFMGPPLSA
jgi:hypothetical protein